MDKKTQPLVIRITQKEKETLEEVCIKLIGNPNKSRLVRKIIREYIYQKPDLLEHELEEFRNCIRNLTGISRNLNQITKKINSGEFKPDILTKNKIDHLHKIVNETNQGVKKYIDNTLLRIDEV